MAPGGGPLEPLARLHARVRDGDPSVRGRPLTGAFLLAALIAVQHEQHGAGEGQPQRGSGTSWLPAAAPMEGLHFAAGGWSMMLHGFVTFVHQDESGPRGKSESFTTNMAMFGVERGRLTLRAMASLEPALGARGYPLLLQTGESADGRNPLFDRQHPHDLFMELSAGYALPAGLFVYFAPVGEPAFGPSAFMHRASAADNPVAPLAHHWLDSAHISYGVLTFGWSRSGKVKLDASVFNGREPDSERWGLDSFRLDSFAGRFTWNPGPRWTTQVSAAWLSSPDRLHAGLDVVRFTASGTYHRPLARGSWETTVAYGRNDTERLTSPPESLPPGVHYHFTPGISPVQRALLAESSLRIADVHTLFARGEWAEKNELFLAADRRHDLVYDAGKISAGYLFDFLRLSRLRLGAGGYAGALFVPRDLELVYGKRPFAWAVYLRLKMVS